MPNQIDMLIKAATEAVKASAIKCETADELSDAIESVYKRLLKLKEDSQPASLIG